MICSLYLFFFNDTATAEIYTLSLHDALPIWPRARRVRDHAALPLVARRSPAGGGARRGGRPLRDPVVPRQPGARRSEEHTSELQSRQYLVCRLLLAKKNCCQRIQPHTIQDKY